MLEPVFAHLGVEMRAYNFAQGGMGTLQQALAGMDLRGKEVSGLGGRGRRTAARVSDRRRAFVDIRIRGLPLSRHLSTQVDQSN